MEKQKTMTITTIIFTAALYSAKSMHAGYIGDVVIYKLYMSNAEYVLKPSYSVSRLCLGSLSFLIKQQRQQPKIKGITCVERSVCKLLTVSVVVISIRKSLPQEQQTSLQLQPQLPNCVGKSLLPHHDMAAWIFKFVYNFIIVKHVLGHVHSHVFT